MLRLLFVPLQGGLVSFEKFEVLTTKDGAPAPALNKVVSVEVQPDQDLGLCLLAHPSFTEVVHRGLYPLDGRVWTWSARGGGGGGGVAHQRPKHQEKGGQ